MGSDPGTVNLIESGLEVIGSHGHPESSMLNWLRKDRKYHFRPLARRDAGGDELEIGEEESHGTQNGAHDNTCHKERDKKLRQGKSLSSGLRKGRMQTGKR